MNFVDIFSGIGGFRLGLESLGFNCVSSIENDKFARKSYESIFGEEPEHKNIRDVQPGQLPEAELYTGGFPCQSFSTAGKRGGFDDTRGTLFFEIMRLAKERQPKYLLLENVRGLLNHDGGATFGTILNTLADVGFDAEWQLLDSKNFRVPQNRERLFIVGYLGGIGERRVFPIRGKTEGDIKRDQIDTKIFDEKRVRPVITPGRVNKRQNGRRAKEKGEPMFTLTKSDIHGVSVKSKIRNLTPRECWRLQGFPDWAFDRAQEVNSDTQLYKQAGNSVTVPVVKEIGKRLKSIMEG